MWDFALLVAVLLLLYAEFAVKLIGMRCSSNHTSSAHKAVPYIQQHPTNAQQHATSSNHPSSAHRPAPYELTVDLVVSGAWSSWFGLWDFALSVAALLLLYAEFAVHLIDMRCFSNHRSSAHRAVPYTQQHPTSAQEQASELQSRLKRTQTSTLRAHTVSIDLVVSGGWSSWFGLWDFTALLALYAQVCCTNH